MSENNTPSLIAALRRETIGRPTFDPARSLLFKAADRLEEYYHEAVDRLEELPEGRA
jgi:hypothetical protein